MADILLTVGVDASLSFKEFQSGITSMVNQVNSNPPKIKVQLDTGSINAMKKQIQDIQTGVANTSNQKSIWLPPTAEIQRATQAKEAYASATQKEAQAESAKASATRQSSSANKTLLQGTKEYSTALNKINALLTQVTVNSKKWTAATGSPSYKQYTKQANELRTLKDELVSGTVTSEQFAKRFGDIQNVTKAASAEIKQAGESTQSFASRVGNLAQKFSTWFGISRIIMATVQNIKKMVNASIELDTAMTELRKVTDETDATYDKFLNNAASRAKDLGASLADTVKATADFARLGFNLEEAEKLADAAIVYKNVGDGITDISTASESVISTMQAFGINASEIMTIVDRFNEVGNNYAISSKGVGDALIRSAAAMNAAGNTLDETIALITAANTVVQDPEKVGTTLKTVSMYLRAAKTEAEAAGESTDGMASSVSELRGEILALTGNKVDIQLDENTFKSTTQILRELAGVWDELTDVSRANILEMIGGKRNSNVVASLLENFNLVEDVIKTSSESAGSALAENEKYLDSINGKIGVLKASFQELSSNIFDSELIKAFVDALRGVVETLNFIADTFGALPTILSTGAFVKFAYTIAISGGHLRDFGDIAAALQLAFPGLASAITATSTAVAGTAGVTAKASAGFTALAGAIGVSATALGVFLGVAVGIAALIGVMDLVTESFDEAKDKADDSKTAYETTAEEVTSLTNELTTLKSRLDELRNKESLTFTEKSELANLEAQNEQLRTQIALKQKLATYQMNKAAEDAANVLTKQTPKTTYVDSPSGSYAVQTFNADIIDDTANKQETLNKKTKEYNELVAKQAGLTPEYSKRFEPDTEYEKNEKKLRKLSEEINTLNEEISGNLTEIDGQYGSLFDDNGNVIKGYEGLVARINGVMSDTAESTEAASDATEEYTSAIETLKTSMSDTVDFHKTLNDALDASASAVGLTSEQIDTLTDKYKDLESFDASALFEETANGVHINADELNRLNEELDASNYAEFEKAIANIRKNIYKQRAEGKDTSALEAELERAKQLKNQYDGLTSSYNKWLAAKSGGNERDSYESLGNEYKEMKEILNQGWFGDKSLNAYLDLLLSSKQRTGDALKDFAKLNKTIEGTSHSIMSYWRYDKDDNLVTDGLFDFLDDVNKKLGDSYARVNKDGMYEFDFDGDKLQKVADAFGMSTEAVELFERAMIDAGMAVDLSDLDITEQISKAADELKKYKKSGKLSDSLDLNFDVDKDSLGDVKNTIDDLKEERIKIDAKANPELAKELDSLIDKCEEQYYFRLNAETDDGLDNAISLIKEMKKLTAAPLSVEARVANEEKVRSLAAQLAELPPEVQTAVGVTEKNVGSINGIISQLNKVPESLDVPVNYTTGAEPDSVADATGTANYELGKYPTTVPNAKSSVDYTLGKYPKYLPPLTQTIYANKIGFASGTAHADGTLMNMWNNYRAYAYGRDWSLHRDESALVNELGTESIVRDGRWFTIPGGAHIHQLKKGDIIFSAKQTEELIKTGHISSGGGHGRVALSTGTAFNTLNMPAYDTGTGGSRRPDSGNSTAKNTYYYKSPVKANTNNKYKKTKKNTEEIFDFIEIAINRIHEAIDRIKLVAESSFKTLIDRNGALDDEIAYTAKEIELQNKAHARYMKEANSVGLSEKWAKKVRDGSIDISKIKDEDLAKKIKQYQEFYEKAIACQDASAQLREEIAELYKTRFENIESDFENQLSLLDHMTETFNNGIEDLEARGYLVSTNYYEALKDTEEQKIATKKQELEALINAMSQAVNSGAIEVGSEAWYEMQQAINDTREAIQEAETEVTNLGNTIRELEWSHFDYLQETISSLTEESDFLIELLGNQDLFNDNGSLTDAGTATIGLHGQNYNVYMAQADAYANEIKNLNDEIAKDPNNTELIKRREELLELQRESILAAEGEKQAMIDLVREGIELELESIQSLIDEYVNALDSAKELHDYQNKIKDQTSEIARLQKQLISYQNDDSEENRAIKQRLEVSLAKAQEELAESEYDKYISDQKQLLDDLYTEYESILNQRLDDVDSLISDLIDDTNANSELIKNTIEKASSDVGYTISTNLSSIWSNEGGANSIITKYGEAFGTQLTSVNAVLKTISDNIAKMIGDSDAAADNTVDGAQPSTSADPNATPVPTGSGSDGNQGKPNKSNSSGKKIKVGGKINAKGAKIYSHKGDKSGDRQYFRKDPIYKVLDIDGSWVKVRHHKQKSGVTGWFKKNDIKAYKTGGLVDYTGFAWVDGQKDKPEAFLSADDTKMFISFRDALRDVANGDMMIPNILNSGSGLDMSNYISGANNHSGIQSANIGDISYEINIPIDHVSDYNDFMNQLRNDGKFEKFIQSMTIDRMVGGGKLSKTKFKW